eukprot:GHVN01051246.1.p1 GENE.GHVN01051246.1~~GHVN01051246.1.p1  ORF type:complete len:674 (+),score=79.58 GHVN01051246.1:79-2022(+)
MSASVSSSSANCTGGDLTQTTQIETHTSVSVDGEGLAKDLNEPHTQDEHSRTEQDKNINAHKIVASPPPPSRCSRLVSMELSCGSFHHPHPHPLISHVTSKPLQPIPTTIPPIEVDSDLGELEGIQDDLDGEGNGFTRTMSLPEAPLAIDTPTSKLEVSASSKLSRCDHSIANDPPQLSRSLSPTLPHDHLPSTTHPHHIVINATTHVALAPQPSHAAYTDPPLQRDPTPSERIPPPYQEVITQNAALQTSQYQSQKSVETQTSKPRKASLSGVRRSKDLEAKSHHHTRANLPQPSAKNISTISTETTTHKRANETIDRRNHHISAKSPPTKPPPVLQMYESQPPPLSPTSRQAHRQRRISSRLPERVPREVTTFSEFNLSGLKRREGRRRARSQASRREVARCHDGSRFALLPEHYQPGFIAIVDNGHRIMGGGGHLSNVGLVHWSPAPSPITEGIKGKENTQRYSHHNWKHTNNTKKHFHHKSFGDAKSVPVGGSPLSPHICETSSPLAVLEDAWIAACNLGTQTEPHGLHLDRNLHCSNPKAEHIANASANRVLPTYAAGLEKLDVGHPYEVPSQPPLPLTETALSLVNTGSTMASALQQPSNSNQPPQKLWNKFERYLNDKIALQPVDSERCRRFSNILEQEN